MRASPTVTTDPVIKIASDSSLSGRFASLTARSIAAGNVSYANTRSAPNTWLANLFRSATLIERSEELVVTII